MLTPRLLRCRPMPPRPAPPLKFHRSCSHNTRENIARELIIKYNKEYDTSRDTLYGTPEVKSRRDMTFAILRPLNRTPRRIKRVRHVRAT